ncbi:hypothetical protein GOP47_0021694 [Adiantum capillus-veneris]|uniref:Alpha-MPP n=1 Tax=Adiantum capillus-veneris TaxID=13818 RepID=A0A9D4U8U7_ADICA|nr:hypothetical protein GOP47_0021694 [Adiantum capillus-veneris]
MWRTSARRFSSSKIKSYTSRGIASTAPRLAIPAVASQVNKGGFLAWLLGEKPATNLPPLFEALPGIKVPPSLPDDLAASPTEVTTLANGLKIASENIAGPTITIGLYVDAGSINESPHTAGAAHLLERMAFKSTRNRSHFRLIREAEAIGANIMASASREQMAYTGDAIKTHMPEVVELLVDSVRNPVFYEWEVKEQVAKVKGELAEIMNNPQSVLMEALHTAGYQGCLAKPLVASESALAQINAESLAYFVQENYTAPRIVLAASGVDHKELLAIAEPLLSTIPATGQEPYEVPASKYVGGDWRGVADTPKIHVALAFEVPGGWRSEKDSIAMTVLQTLLGGGGSFSAGGPGKGMYSRLYTRVLNQYSEVQSIVAFSSIYNDTGLFGLHGCSDAEFALDLVDIFCKELIETAQGTITEKELTRAKNSTVSSVLMNLESRVIVTEDIGRQMLTYGHRKPVQSFVDQVNALTIADIQGILLKVLKTPLTMASWGDVTHAPRYDEIASRFK